MASENIIMKIGNANTPRLGEYWHGEGGVFVGTMRGTSNHPDYHLIVSPDEVGSFKNMPWGCEGKEISGANAPTDSTVTRATRDGSTATWAAKATPVAITVGRIPWTGMTTCRHRATRRRSP